ncbi:MAG: VOC family protein [Acidimicrobiia bacterium]|nr:VOC family protein [Acidimicrobiia bacterium]
MTTLDPRPDPELRSQPDLHPKGVNHLALSTSDMKGQLEFWCDVLGCPLKALYWMHGVDNTFHGFVELAPDSYVAFVQHPDNATEIEYGITHAGNAGAPVTRGAMQHVALHVDQLDDVLAMRDRIRSRGVQVMGPIDHGMIQSIYFAGPEGLSLEVCTGSDIDARAWIDPEVQGLCGIGADEVEAMKAPALYDRPGESVPQPPPDSGRPRMNFPPGVLDAIMSTSDADMWERASETVPPVAVDR